MACPPYIAILPTVKRNVYKSVGILLLLFLCTFNTPAQDSNCTDEVIQKAQSVDQVLDELPDYTDDKQILELIISSIEPAVKKSIQRSVAEYNTANYTVDQKICFADALKVENKTWWAEFLKPASTQLFGRQSFEQGNYIIFSLKPYGGSDLFGDDEAYLGTYALRYGRAIGKRDGEKGSRFRWSVGPGLYYQDEFIFTANPNFEFNLFEQQLLGLEVFSGILELSHHVGINENLNASTAGFSLEAYFINFNVVSAGYQTLTDDFFVQSGVQLHIHSLFELF